MRKTAFILAGLMACTACTPRDGGGSGGSDAHGQARVRDQQRERVLEDRRGRRAASTRRRARSRSTSRCRPTARPRSRTRSSRTWSSQGYDAIAVSVIAPNDQVPVLNHVAEKTQAHHLRLRRAAIEAPALHRHQQLRGRQGARRRDRQAPAQRRQDGGVRRHALRRQRGPAPQGHRGRDRRPQHRDRRQARGQHRPRQGALERRGHRQRAPRPEPGRGPLVVQRPRHRGGARGARQEGQGPGGRVRRGGRHARRHRERHHRRARSCRSRSSSATSSSKWMHDLATKLETAKAAHPAGQASTRASRSSTRTTSPTSRRSSPS